MQPIKILFTLAIAVMTLSASASEPPKLKMTTATPPGIAMPDKLSTSLGELTFFDGVPDRATTQKLYDNLDLSRAIQAYTNTIHIASMQAMRRSILEFGPANYTVLSFEDMMDSKTLFLTPNTTSVYNFMVLDLKDGPIVAETPPGVLGIVDGAWFNYVADFGNAGPDKGKGGKYLFLPPGWDGKIPEGDFIVKQATTFSHWFLWRGFPVNGDPKPAVETTRKTFRMYPLGQRDSAPKMNFINVSGNPFSTIGATDYRFWQDLNATIQYEPPEGLNTELAGQLAALGISKGKAFKPDDRMKKILTDAANIGHATARALVARQREDVYFYYPGESKWAKPFLGGYQNIDKNGAKILDARAMFFFFATGVTPAMNQAPIGAGSQYAMIYLDENSNPLDGSKTYKVHLPPNVPAKDFWSFVVYDNQTRSMLQTDQQYPSVSSAKGKVKPNADGSYDVYFGPKAPKGKEDNWIQTVPGKGWNMLFRLYGPLKPWFDKTWRPSDPALAGQGQDEAKMAPASDQAASDAKAQPVTDANFAQAESAHNFANWAKLGADKQMFHYREIAPVGPGAPTIRMNWDTLYSNRIVKVSGDKTFNIFMPDSDLYQAAQVIDENGFSPYYLVEKGKNHQVTVDTDYAWVLFRTEIKDRNSKKSLDAVHTAQDGIKVTGMLADSTYIEPKYDQAQLTKLREAYKKEFLASGTDFTYAKKAGEVDQHVLNLSHAAGWGGYPPELHSSNAYSSAKTMSADQCRAITFPDPKNRFFTSFTLYDAEGYLMAGNTYINSHNWDTNDDTTITLSFNCDATGTNSLTSGGKDFNYVIRNYGVSQYVLDGKFKPLAPQIVKKGDK